MIPIPRVTLPEGCYGITTADGTKYDANRTGQIEVQDRHVRDIRKQYGTAGIITASEQTVMGTKSTRVCVSCTPTRRWQAWTTVCPRCEAETIIEEQK